MAKKKAEIAKHKPLKWADILAVEPRDPEPQAKKSIVKKHSTALRMAALEQQVAELTVKLETAQKTLAYTEGGLSQKLKDLESAKGVMLHRIEVQAGRMNKFEEEYPERVRGMQASFEQCKSDYKNAQLQVQVHAGYYERLRKNYSELIDSVRLLEDRVYSSWWWRFRVVGQFEFYQYSC